MGVQTGARKDTCESSEIRTSRMERVAFGFNPIIQSSLRNREGCCKKACLSEWRPNGPYRFRYRWYRRYDKVLLLLRICSGLGVQSSVQCSFAMMLHSISKILVQTS